jgi:hypothetical protein
MPRNQKEWIKALEDDGWVRERGRPWPRAAALERSSATSRRLSHPGPGKHR